MPRRVQYPQQAFFDPATIGDAEVVKLEDFWQPWSEPVRQLPGVLFAAALISASGITIDPDTLGEAAAAVDTSTEWLVPWSEPVRTDPKVAYVVAQEPTSPGYVPDGIIRLSDGKMPKVAGFAPPIQANATGTSTYYTILTVNGGRGLAAIATTADVPTDDDWAEFGGNVHLNASGSSTTGIESYWVHKLGDDLHVATHQTDGRLAYHVFDMEDGDWTIRDQEIIKLGDDVEYDDFLTGGTLGISLAVRTGVGQEVIVAWAGQDSSGNDQTLVIIESGGTWGSPLVADASGTQGPPVIVGPDASDRMYIFGEFAASFVSGIALLSNDTFGSAFVVDGVDTADVVVGAGIIEDGEYWVPIIDSDNVVSVYHDTFADSPGSPTQIATVTDLNVYGHGRGTEPYVPFNLTADDKGQIRLLHVRDAAQDIYLDNNVEFAGLSDDTSVLTGITVNRLASSVSPTDQLGPHEDLIFLYEEDGTPTVTKFGIWHYSTTWYSPWQDAVPDHPAKQYLAGYPSTFIDPDTLASPVVSTDESTEWWVPWSEPVWIPRGDEYKAAISPSYFEDPESIGDEGPAVSAGWWPIELKKKRRVRYARSGRKILSWTLERDRFQPEPEPLKELPEQLPTLRRVQPEIYLPDYQQALILSPDFLPQPPQIPEVTSAQVDTVLQQLREGQQSQSDIQRAIEAAIERDDEEALIMILLETV